MILCYITDRKQLSSNEDESRRRLLDVLAAATKAGVDLIQLREKDLRTRALLELAAKASEIVRSGNANNAATAATRLLINSRIDVAIACGADGVHLRADDISAADARAVFSQSGIVRSMIGVSCHTAAEVALAEGKGADFALFGPVFEKAGNSRQDGITELERVCRDRHGLKPAIPILAIGGVTDRNVCECLHSGAAGIAAIRLFQGNDIMDVVARLRHSAS